MDERQKRRHRRNIRRIRQRNRRVALAVVLTGILVWAVVGNISKPRKEAGTRQVYAENETEEEKKDEKESSQEIKMADEDEKDQWYLKLVNAKNPMSQEDVPQVVTETIDSEGYQVDARILGDLEAMFEDAEKAGKSIMICSAFRAWDTQEYLYQNKIQRVMNEQGLDEEKAAVEAATVVAVPGTSEHQIGLALDIVSSQYTNLDEGQMQTEDQKWLIENCWKYGFILRYPEDRSDITGIVFEPWHYRYVGKKAAKEITEQNITLEEYLGAEAVGSP